MESLAIRKQIDPAALVSTYSSLVQLFLERHEIKEANRYSIMVHAELSKQPNERESLKYFMLQGCIMKGWEIFVRRLSLMHFTIH